MLAATISAALDEILRRAGNRVIGPAEGRDASVPIVIDAHVEPNLPHPLGVADGTRRGAAHLLRCAPATLYDHQRVEQLLFPVGFPPRLPPCQSGERRNDGAHVIFLDIGIT